MLLPGHKALLKRTLSRLSESERQTLLQTSEALQMGLYYPDLPCAERHVRNGIVTHDKLKLCSLAKLLMDDRLLEVYASHKGAMAYLHAMAPTPMSTVRSVRNAIAEQILILACVAVCDDTTQNLQRASTRTRYVPNAFWLGQALHVLMDSYSPAHTLRASPTQKHVASQFKDQLNAKHAREIWTNKVPASDQMAVDIYNSIEKAAKKYTKDKEVQRTLVTELDIEAWLVNWVQKRVADARDLMQLKKVRQRIVDAFEVFVFNSSIMTQYKIPQVIAGATTIAAKSPETASNTITTFYNYSLQSKFQHMRKDRLSYVAKQKLDGLCVDDCSELIRWYVRAVREVYQEQNNDRQKQSTLQTRIRQLAQWLLSKPLKLTDGFANSTCSLSFENLE